MRLNFSPNTPRTRKKLIPGEFYLTIYNNAASICISVYRGDDVWQNPFKNYQTATNKVTFFAPTSVFKIPSFKGWEGVSVPEPEDDRTPKRWESASFYLLMLKKDGILRLYTPAGSELHTFYPTSPYKNPTEWLTTDGEDKAVLMEDGSIVLSKTKGEWFQPTTFTPIKKLKEF